MTDKLNFNLPQHGAKNSPSSKGLFILIAAGFVTIVANVILTITYSGRSARSEAVRTGSLSSEACKDLALKLEKQGLTARAVEAWKEYLALAAPAGEETARILYRIGTLYQDVGDYDRALDSYYRSESCATVPEISQEISKRTGKCLEALGKFAVLRYELDERVGANTNSRTAGAEIVAELDSRKITREELDRVIEDRIEKQLDRFASALPDEERKKQKEAMFQRASSASERMQTLNNLVAEELLYRRAIELKLGEDQKIRDMLRDMERSVLAEYALRKELTDKIRISKNDVETWYEAHKKNYTTPERAKVAHIQVKDEDAAKAVKKRLDAGDKFEDVAKELSIDKTTSANGGVIEGWVDKGIDMLPSVGNAPGASEIIFGTIAGKVSDKTIKTGGGISLMKTIEIEGEHQRALEEVQQAVYGDMYAAKEREAQESLFEQLKKQYSVVIHASAFKVDDVQQKSGPGDK
jgi:tetratricopeptide (TPR) repeat protein